MRIANTQRSSDALAVGITVSAVLVVFGFDFGLAGAFALGLAFGFGGFFGVAFRSLDSVTAISTALDGTSAVVGM